MRPKFFAEGVATFCLVFAGTAAIVVNETTQGAVTPLGICLVFGLVVLAMIYAVGHISGAHMNPAVTIGFYAAGRLSGRELLPYFCAQFAGALAASALVRLMFLGSTVSLGVTLPAGSWAQALLMEAVLTFMLMFVIMGVAIDERAQGAMAGIAIGAVIAFEAMIGGPVSGASMNPARSFAPALLSGNFTHHWIYWAGPISGAVAGAVIYKQVSRR